MGDGSEVIALLRGLLAEVRGLRADLRREATDTPALVSALEVEFGPGRFTVAGVLDLADLQPHGAIAAALASLIDLDAAPRARATSLGILLRRLREVATVAESGGCAVYQLRT